MLHITTAGESHGKGLFLIIEGLPAGLKIDAEKINGYLALRQSGYGRGARQKIEHDTAEILSGVRNGITLGSPLTVAVFNRDYETWKTCMASEGCDTTLKRVTAVRPGHADYTGMKKFNTDDARNILERASARATAIRVAAGSICRGLLEELGIQLTGYVRSVGTVEDKNFYSFEEIERGRLTELFMLDKEKQSEAMRLIDKIKEAGDTVGGTVELRVKGLKSGFGSCMTDGEKLDARLCFQLMSIQAVKGVEIGLGFESARRLGSEVHDELFVKDGSVVRKTNRAGGIEGGMSNGEELILRAAMKPIPTLMRGLNTVDVATMKTATAATERSDVCAISALEVIGESVIATELLSVLLERLGGDTLEEVKERYGRLQ